MDQFRQGLRNDVKDILLTFHEDPKSLTKAISRAMRCDNRLFERRSKCQHFSITRVEPTYASVVANPSSSSIQPLNTFQASGTTPMEIDMTLLCGTLSEAEKQRRRANRLCLYCGGPGQ